MTKLALLNVDLSQAELRVMALLSEDDWMCDALQEGTGDYFDNHMMPVCFPHIVEEFGSIENYKSFLPVQHKEDRTKVKGIQYGLSFGRQPPAIAKALGISVQEAKVILDNYLSTAHRFNQWRHDVQEAAVNPAKRDLLVNPFGRRYQSEIVTNSNYQSVQREALAFLPQSTSSDICLSTAIRINKPLKAQGYRIFNMVHDAIMIEGPEDGLEDVGKYVGLELRATGEAVFGTRVPFLSDYSIGESWSDLS